MLKVLHLPYNIASFPSITVNALNKLPGIEARGLILDNPHKFHDQQGIRYVQPYQGSKLSPAKWFSLAMNFTIFAQAVAWSDVIHWYWDANCFPLEMDLKVVKLLKKPLFVEWLGSDIRHANSELKDNPYYKQILEEGYEYKDLEKLEKSLARQRLFSKYNAFPVLCAEMVPYLDTSLFAKIYNTRQRIDLSKFAPHYPDPNKPRPLIVHSPTAPVAKGTRYVLEAIEHLQQHYDLEFRLIQNMDRSEAVENIRECDIMLDQFVLGGHGLAATEAMAYGKPVLCYIKPANQALYPPDLPLINASPDDLVEKLEPLVKDAALRHETGRKSRAYAEKYHDANLVAKDLVNVYREVLSRAK
jgi:hypothetical protein